MHNQVLSMTGGFQTFHCRICYCTQCFVKLYASTYFAAYDDLQSYALIYFASDFCCSFAFQVEQADILPTEMVFTIKKPPGLGHVVKLTNSSDGVDSPVLDYIHTFTQDDIDEGRILYVSASTQVHCHLV